MFQVSIQLAGSILYAVAFVNYNIVPMYFAQLWSVMLVHQVFIRCQKNIEFLVNNPFPKIERTDKEHTQRQKASNGWRGD